MVIYVAYQNFQSHRSTIIFISIVSSARLYACDTRSPASTVQSKTLLYILPRSRPISIEDNPTSLSMQYEARACAKAEPIKVSPID